MLIFCQKIKSLSIFMVFLLCFVWYKHTSLWETNTYLYAWSSWHVGKWGLGCKLLDKVYKPTIPIWHMLRWFSELFQMYGKQYNIKPWLQLIVYCKTESLTVLTKLPLTLYYCMIIHSNDDDAGGGDKNQIRYSYLLIVPQLLNHATLSLHVSSMHYQSSGLSDNSQIITLQIYWTMLSEALLFQPSRYHYTDIFLLFTSTVEQLGQVCHYSDKEHNMDDSEIGIWQGLTFSLLCTCPSPTSLKVNVWSYTPILSHVIELLF